MLRKGLALALFALCAAPMFASVELDTSINDVFNRGTNELAGSITWTVNSDDFQNASTETPIFIRVTPDHNSFLSETLVFLPGGGRTADPINLAMKLDGGLGAVSMVALPEAVSIVRWVEDESSLWIRVQQTSDQWLSVDGGGLVGPSENLEVSWEIGVTARQSDINHASDTIFANLPFNTRVSSASEGDYFDATSTLICVNLSQSNLFADGSTESLLNYDIIAFDHNAEIGVGVYSATAGNDTGINFTNDFSIARGKSRACEIQAIPFDKSLRQDAQLCIDRSGTNETELEFVKVYNVLTFEVRCSFGGNFLDTLFLQGAHVDFTTDGRENYGFQDSGNVWFTGDNGANNMLFGSSSVSGGFANNGVTLYTDATLTYEGTTQYSLNGWLRASVAVCLWTHYLDDPTDASVDWQLTLVSHEGEFDSEPFDRTDGEQNRRCEPSEFAVGDPMNFVVGSFLECTGNPVSIFFPYLPRLVGNSDFWVGLSYVNQGAVDFADDRVQTIFYDENGERYTGSMPGLGVHEQQTWTIMANDTTGIGEISGAPGSSTFGTTVSVLPDNPDVGPESFGATRMSMYVRGTFDTIFNDDVANGDLDGYLLIGQFGTGSIDGAYLPRNTDSYGVQHADLPIVRSKAGQANEPKRNYQRVFIQGDKPYVHPMRNK
jgi:hypothetical protein